MNNKKIDRITAIAVAISVIVCLLFMLLPNGTIASTEKSFEYPEKLFGTDIIEINIEADEDEWQEMLDNAISETYIPCNLTVNGTEFKMVGIRPKGNSSLSMVAGTDSDRFSFKFQFDEYIDGQTCFGLDKLVVNNMQADYTYMKEYFSYYLMNYMGVECPLVNYAHITVNGEEWGTYLAVECYEDSFVERVYQSSNGNLYSVKMAMGRGKEEPGEGLNMKDFESMKEKFRNGDTSDLPDMSNMPAPPDFGAMPGSQGAGANGRNMPTMPGSQGEGADGGNMPTMSGNQEENAAQNGQAGVADSQSTTDNIRKSRGMMGRGGFGSTSGGGSLVYTDDDSDNYSSIFDNAVFKRSGEKDYQRVITALKKLSEGEKLEEYFDVDQILRYFAVHTAVVNLDSYISNMQQNYCLYEEDGKVTILPWDYNLAFGGFQSGSAEAAINFPIDTPISGVELSERPLIGKLLEVDEYKQRYHEYLQQIVDFINRGDLAKQIDTVDTLISGYVEKDATAFCTYDQYKSAVDTFKEFCQLRAKSIQGQLNGTIPSTTDEQSGSDALIAADGINLSTMGTQGGGGEGGPGGWMKGAFGGFGGFGGVKEWKNNVSTASSQSSQVNGNERSNAVNSSASYTVNEEDKGSEQSSGAEGSTQMPQMPGGDGTQMQEKSSGDSTQSLQGDDSQIHGAGGNTQMSQMPGGDGTQMPGADGNTQMPQPPQMTEADGNAQPPQMPSSDGTQTLQMSGVDGNAQPPQMPSSDGTQTPQMTEADGNAQPPQMPGMNGSIKNSAIKGIDSESLIWMCATPAALIAGICFAAFYKRNKPSRKK